MDFAFVSFQVLRHFNWINILFNLKFTRFTCMTSDFLLFRCKCMYGKLHITLYYHVYILLENLA